MFCSVLLTTDHLIKKEFGLAFFGYFFTSTLFTYSYLGEKVPWLSQYPIYAALTYFPLYFDNLYKQNYFDSYKNYSLVKLVSNLGYGIVAIGMWLAYETDKIEYSDRLILGLGALLLIISFAVNTGTKTNIIKFVFIILTFITFRSTILTNFVYAGTEVEILSQVHTTYEFDKILRRIRSEIESHKIGVDLSVYAAGEPIWPMTAYLQGLKGHKYQLEENQFNQTCYLFDTRDQTNFTAPDSFEKKEVTLRGWWLPETQNITLKKYLMYVFYHKPWNPPGYSYARMYINHNPTCGNSHMLQ